MTVSEACQINDLDHGGNDDNGPYVVSEACQINDLDHNLVENNKMHFVSEACQINDLDHFTSLLRNRRLCFRSLSDQ